MHAPELSHFAKRWHVCEQAWYFADHTAPVLHLITSTVIIITHSKIVPKYLMVVGSVCLTMNVHGMHNKRSCTFTFARSFLSQLPVLLALYAISKAAVVSIMIKRKFSDIMM